MPADCLYQEHEALANRQRVMRVQAVRPCAGKLMTEVATVAMYETEGRMAAAYASALALVAVVSFFLG